MCCMRLVLKIPRAQYTKGYFTSSVEPCFTELEQNSQHIKSFFSQCFPSVLLPSLSDDDRSLSTIQQR